MFVWFVQVFSNVLLFGSIILQTLEHRQKVNQSMFVSQLINNELDEPSLLEKLNIYAPARTLRSRNLLYTVPRRTLYRSNDPLLSMVRQFNNCINHFDFNPSTDSYKSSLLLLLNFGDNSRRYRE